MNIDELLAAVPTIEPLALTRLQAEIGRRLRALEAEKSRRPGALVMGIDPGTERTAYWLGDPDNMDRPTVAMGWLENERMLARIREWIAGTHTLLIAVEWVTNYGKPVGSDTFEMIRWIGRFHQAIVDYDQPGDVPEPVYLRRPDVARRLAGAANVKEPLLRQILLDRWGGSARAVGRKKTPGPLYGVKSHVWSALAVAVAAKIPS